MIQFTTAIHKYEKNKDKTGWTFLEIPVDLAEQLNPQNKKSFRVKGTLDNYSIKGVSLLPIGGGIFIMPLNMAIRKGIGKKQGAMVRLKLEIDKSEYKLNQEFVECLADEPKALDYFNTFSRSVQRYYSKWIEDAKTEETRIKRIALAVTSLSKKMDYGQMLRSQKKEKG